MLSLSGKNILVTGGAGFIGSHIVDLLIPENPHNLVVMDNLFLGKIDNLRKAKAEFPKLKFYSADVSDLHRLTSIIKKEKIDVTFNLAVIPLPTSLKKPFFTIDKNIAITLNLCEILRKKYFQTLIHFSSSEVYGTAEYVPMDENHPVKPLTPYAASKAASDHIVLSYYTTFGVDVAIIRPFNNYGPRQNMDKYAGIIPIVVKKAMSHQPIIIYGDGKQTRDYIYVEDVARAAVDIYKEPAAHGKAVNIASGCEISINDLVLTILKILKSHVKILHKEYRHGDVRRHCADIKIAKQIIGFSPKTDFKKGLSQTINWYKNAIKKEN